MQVKALRMIMASALAGAALIWAGRLLAWTGGAGAESVPAVHFAAAYAFSLLAFAACPATRRGDLAKLCFLSGALLCLVRGVSRHEDMTLAIAAEAMGATAAVLPSALERLRSALRADPEALVSLRDPRDRRMARRRREPVFSRRGLVRT